MEWIRENWFFLLFFILFAAMHLVGHGGCGGHGGHEEKKGHWGHGEGFSEEKENKGGHRCC